MTKTDLHALPKFGELFSDPRFKACITYLREHANPKRNSSLSEATSIIRSEGSWHGWFDALYELEKLSEPPRENPPMQRGPAYPAPQPQHANA